MKTLNLFALLTVILCFSLSAQDLAEPKDIGVSEYDNFKKSSFDIMKESATLKESATTVDNEVKTYSGAMNTIGIDKLKQNYKALKEGTEAVGTLSKELAELNGKSQDVLSNAKGIKPKMKSVGAVKNTNKSIQALDASKADLSATKELLSNNLKLIGDELKSRGEIIE
ncbi:hypothetical protein SAMN04488029_0718 [Reichenbachiella faecimaris]|uniref:Uncharacterized protein n=1 Tax=Reichenbachiella faecimaris TaxID=692418 RepID=A0A1W2G6X9_REIFA|nr:hypothetical protein [Reichenbachiella faecimaris]SMD32373.1 hypothetical protein SAMN04488029_0718 [Reichenbachiella faecimaris]